MATIKEAVQNAATFSKETLEPERVASLQLEEVESAKVGDEDAWLITLSMVAPPQGTTGALNAALNAPAEPKRDYKIFTVLKATGEAVSTRIRELTFSVMLNVTVPVPRLWFSKNAAKLLSPTARTPRRLLLSSVARWKNGHRRSGSRQACARTNGHKPRIVVNLVQGSDIAGSVQPGK
jgi:hypothetical protein